MTHSGNGSSSGHKQRGSADLEWHIQDKAKHETLPLALHIYTCHPADVPPTRASALHHELCCFCPCRDTRGWSLAHVCHYYLSEAPPGAATKPQCNAGGFCSVRSLCHPPQERVVWYVFVIRLARNRSKEKTNPQLRFQCISQIHLTIDMLLVCVHGLFGQY